MTTNKIESVINEKENYLKNVSIDNVIFGYHDKELKVLLQKPYVYSKWTLTGGYVKKTETIEDAANRIAYLRTGLKDLFFQQFRSFGGPERLIDNEFSVNRFNELFNKNFPKDFWMFDYFVSIGFFTLTEFSAVILRKGNAEELCEWWPVSELPPLMFDHSLIIMEALKAMRLHIEHYPIGYNLLPEKFTVPDLHSLYETILGKSLDYRNFSKRILVLGIVEKLKETKSIGAHRSPFLYRFNKEKYEKGFENGVSMTF